MGARAQASAVSESEVLLEHTRGAVVRGSGKYYSGPGFSSMWYFPRAQELQKSNKMLLMDNAYERNAMTGFRCASDDVADGEL